LQRSLIDSSKEEEDGQGKEAGGQGRGRKVIEGRVYPRSTLHHLAIQRGDGQEVKWQVENVYELH